ncbi:MAG TPA: 5'-nucleotidase C-terminal domain-containing protein [Pusillimonas sp.]|nr:5'-nucleotidase C-terminal domain-containing protein [Pusillimonas sp.]
MNALPAFGAHACAAALALLAGCAGTTSQEPEHPSATNESSGYTLTVLHINDHHSHLDESSLPLMMATGPTKREPILVPAGGFARVASAMHELASRAPARTIKIHAGDAITGDLYYPLTDGQADADLMNMVCFDTFTLGNHEFDHGDAALKRFIDRLHDGECKTQVLSANVRFGPESALNPTQAPDYVQPWVVLERDSRRIGLIGLTVAAKTQNASRPDPGTTFLEEAASAQAAIDELERLGVDIIVLQSHYGYKADLTLAKQLRGVDAIIGGDSHTLLGPDSMKNHGLAPKGPYPTHTTDRNGKPVCVAQAGHYGYVVGELILQFDITGHLLSCQGTPHALIGTDFKPARRDRAPLSNADVSAIMGEIARSGFLRVTDPDARAVAALAPHQARKLAFGSSVVTHAPHTLCTRRVPGTNAIQGGPGRGENCAADARLSRHGGDTQQLVAQAYLHQARTYFEADLALINAGGVRTDIPAGPVTVKDIYNLLPFNNQLVQLKVSGTMLEAALESAVDAAFAPKPSSGAFPYAAGMRWRVDARQPKGSRLSHIEVQQPDGTYEPLDRTKIYNVATIDFIADGKDHYLPFMKLKEHERVDAGLDATQLFLDYAIDLAKQKRGLTRPATDEYSTQAFVSATDP